ncbi:hypothetical protein [Levilactobacillus zymae]|uniref:Uncharacterized protein n=1 Tax=Levilactobacillus zymae TaxID=267363 RepID=A0A1Y6K1S2_9LACO|nr:hypothetical protein [Levilactobacillus zymae]SMS15043.1 hypothetical protein LZ3411_1993 [Levilactobacillus zymae]
MELPIAQDYLLLTENITNRPVLRTRFTTQAYLVLATFLDLRQQKLITIDQQHVTVPNQARLAAALPASLQMIAQRLQAALNQSDQTEDVFKLLVSWNLANAVYDTIGPQLERRQLVEKVIFQNNLMPHTIYVPTDAAKQALSDQLGHEVQTQTLTPAHRELLVIFQQLEALKWVLPSDQVTAATTQLTQDPATTQLRALTAMAAHRITMRKFELDSWLS